MKTVSQAAVAHQCILSTVLCSIAATASKSVCLKHANCDEPTGTIASTDTAASILNRNDNLITKPAIPVVSSTKLLIPLLTRSQAVARIADRTAKNCKSHVT